ncbi:MAG: hypothetical protein KBF69_04980, partial [Saprospiraceae bacterium]|nr:hypothetical protein [Saprospiraceae bacterium]
QDTFSLIPNRFNDLKKNEMRSGVTSLIYPARFIKSESQFRNTQPERQTYVHIVTFHPYLSSYL